MATSCFAEQLTRHVPLSDAEKTALTKLEENPRKIKRGAMIQRANEPITELFVLREGRVMSFVILPDQTYGIPFDHLVTQGRVEVDAVGLEQRPGRGVVALRLDPLHLSEQRRDSHAERPPVHHHVERFAIARPRLDGIGVRHQPVDDHLAVAHVVFFDLGPLADTT